MIEGYHCNQLAPKIELKIAYVIYAIVFAETLKWSCPKVGGAAPPPLAAHGCAVIGSDVYMFGGLSPVFPGAQDSLYCLNTGM